MNARDKLITWLQDAHAMERSLENVLERHVDDAENQPELRSRLESHLAETQTHADRVEGCLQLLGAEPSRSKSMAGGMMGAIQGMATGAFEDEIVKNLLADYAMEHFEMACYSALIAAATEAGEETIVSACEEILRDEMDMAEWLEEQIPEVTRVYLQQAADFPR